MKNKFDEVRRKDRKLRGNANHWHGFGVVTTVHEWPIEERENCFGVSDFIGRIVEIDGLKEIRPLDKEHDIEWALEHRDECARVRFNTVGDFRVGEILVFESVSWASGGMPTDQHGRRPHKWTTEAEIEYCDTAEEVFKIIARLHKEGKL